MKTPEHGSEGWQEWRNHVLTRLDDLKESQEKVHLKLTEVEIDLASLKVKIGLIGALAGMIPLMLDKLLKP